MNTKEFLIKELRKYRNTQKEEVFKSFFKTGKGEYGEGDIFWGITVPDIRNVAKKYYIPITINEIKELINSEIHEIRLTGYLILTYKYEKGSTEEKENIANFYLDNLKGANNWDIVDLSCYKILGSYLIDNPQKRYILYKLVNSSNLWEQRISIVSTFAFIRSNDFVDTLNISKILLKHKHDLIHKAVGWMLREVGKRDINILKKFLKENIKEIPRTTLRYAIEKMDERERKYFLSL
ncbi:DNA alkylation repair protein [Candidatus Dojkabacteria bacterium]|uniref:DNA alkylation repair protein n=1 Tax=Candidatus Dojkabacteria bacterium TaxID=2099670 RepID=A0A847EU56_9BACT|nr:DNA alkylation repair protein [Candidatus Dojkabacteria bacterium]